MLPVTDGSGSVRVSKEKSAVFFGSVRYKKSVSTEIVTFPIITRDMIGEISFAEIQSNPK